MAARMEPTEAPVSLRGVAPDTLRLLERASIVCRSYRSDAEVSVTGIVLAMPLGEDEASAWFASDLHVDAARWAVRSHGLDAAYESARARPDGAIWASRSELIATGAAAALLGFARDVLKEVEDGGALEPRHVLGALLYRGNENGWFLPEMGVDRFACGERFLSWISGRRPREAARWARVAAATGVRNLSTTARASAESVGPEQQQGSQVRADDTPPPADDTRDVQKPDIGTGDDLAARFAIGDPITDTLLRALGLARAASKSGVALVEPAFVLAGMLSHAFERKTDGASRILRDLALQQKLGSGSAMERGAALLEAAGGSLGTSVAMPSSIGVSDLAPATAGALARAARLAAQAWVTPPADGPTRNRHLLAALVTGATAADADVRKVLAQLGSSPGDVRERLLRWARDVVSPRSDHDEPWARLLEVGPLAGYGSDAPEGQDLLDLRREVDALATLIAARDVTPPLSIGLFGPWGSGKTFFMKRIESRIAELCADSRAANGRSPHCSRVVPIWFNAWTYMDADLWASLASEVFRQLGSAVERADGGEAARTLREKLALKLASSQARVEDAEAERTQAEKAEKAAKDKLDEFVKGREETSRQLALATRNSAEVADALSAAGKVLGLDPAVADVTGALRAVRDAKGKLGRLVALWKRLSTSKQIVSIAILALAPIAIAVVVDAVKDSAWMSAVSGFLAMAAAAVCQALAWFKPLLGQLDGARERIEKAAGDVERAGVQIAEQTASEEQRFRAALASAQGAVDRAQATHLAARQHVDAAEAEIADLRSGRLLDRFIRDRLAAGDYQKKLGMVALVRSDFDRLAQLVREQPEIARADRIVLFVDDLDRCPTSLVAEVLQAVHLLLAFPLFVVVVGVDARWVVHSLAQHHAELTAEPESDGRVATSTPIQYLEKIFQIPYRLSSLGRSGYEQLITAMTSVPDEKKEGAATTGPRTALAAAAPSVGAVASPPATSANVSAPEAKPAAPVTPSGPGMSPDSTALGGGQPVGRNGANGERGQPEAPPTAPELLTPAEPLRLGPHEVSFMKGLHALIPSPRSAKRFVNLYRFLRATLESAQRADLANAQRADHKAVAVLLAAICGYPEEADDLLGAIAEADKNVAWRKFVEKFGKSGNASPVSAFAQTLCPKLAAAEDGSLTDVPLATFQRWLPHVSRFSFNTAAAHGPAEEEPYTAPRSQARAVRRPRARS
jgi:KAP-like P-loop domain-containing protein